MNFRANQKRYWNCETFAEQHKLGIRLWDIPWVQRRFEQDNDDESEEEDEEKSDQEEEPSMPPLVKEI